LYVMTWFLYLRNSRRVRVTYAEAVQQ
jgi:hypothetical protein